LNNSFCALHTKVGEAKRILDHTLNIFAFHIGLSTLFLQSVRVSSTDMCKVSYLYHDS